MRHLHKNTLPGVVFERCWSMCGASVQGLARRRVVVADPREAASRLSMLCFAPHTHRSAGLERCGKRTMFILIPARSARGTSDRPSSLQHPGQKTRIFARGRAPNASFHANAAAGAKGWASSGAGTERTRKPPPFGGGPRASNPAQRRPSAACILAQPPSRAKSALAHGRRNTHPPARHSSLMRRPRGKPAPDAPRPTPEHQREPPPQSKLQHRFLYFPTVHIQRRSRPMLAKCWGQTRQGDRNSRRHLAQLGPNLAGSN